MVEANTSSLMLSVDTPWVDSNASGVSHSRATTVTLSLLSPALRKASSTSSGTACDTVLRPSCLAISSSLSVPQRPSEHNRMRSPCSRYTGPVMS